MQQFFKNIFVLFLVVSLLLGCGVTDQDIAGKSQVTLDDISEFNIVEMVNEDSVLIGSTYYKIDKNTKMLKADNQDLLFEELQPGDLVRLEDDGYQLLSFPGQGFATSVVLQNDAESVKVSDSLKYFFEEQDTGDILSTSIQELTDQSILIHFYEREIHGKKYEAKIDRTTNEFSIKEIVNEEALEQERRNQEMAAAHPEGSTAGHITEIYDDGFRVNMADYIFADDVKFMNDLGEELKKDQFLIGNLVRVNYDKLDSMSTISQGVLSELTLITKEENSEVRKWIERIMESDYYKDPVIMASHTNHDFTYYSIRVADLKDDTWDTFELKYDIQSKTHTTTRLKN